MLAKCLGWSYGTQWVRTVLEICRLRTVEVENLATWGQSGHITVHHLKLFIITAWYIYRTEHWAKVSRIFSYDWSFQSSISVSWRVVVEFFGMIRQTNSGSAEQQEITSTTWEGHQTAFYGILKHLVTSRSVYSNGVAIMRGREAWKFCWFFAFSPWPSTSTKDGDPWNAK